MARKSQKSEYDAFNQYRPVRVKKAKKSDTGRRGIHILNPTKRELYDAKLQAINRDFHTVWVHGKMKRVV
jgi:hypothetical protein